MTIRGGIDVGQKRDPTAIAIVEVEPRREGDGVAEHYVVPFLERLPLGASYPGMARRLAEIVANIDANVPQRPTGRHGRLEPMPVDLELYGDATGVGSAVLDVLNEGLGDGGV